MIHRQGQTLQAADGVGTARDGDGLVGAQHRPVRRREDGRGDQRIRRHAGTRRRGGVTVAVLGADGRADDVCVQHTRAFQPIQACGVSDLAQVPGVLVEPADGVLPRAAAGVAGFNQVKVLRPALDPRLGCRAPPQVGNGAAHLRRLGVDLDPGPVQRDVRAGIALPVGRPQADLEQTLELLLQIVDPRGRVRSRADQGCQTTGNRSGAPGRPEAHLHAVDAASHGSRIGDGACDLTGMSDGLGQMGQGRQVRPELRVGGTIACPSRFGVIARKSRYDGS